MLWKACATATGLSEQHYIELHPLESVCLSRSWYRAGREGVRMSLMNDSVYPHFNALNQTDFGCAPTSAAGATAVWLNLESPQRKLKDREQCAPGEDASHHSLCSVTFTWGRMARLWHRGQGSEEAANWGSEAVMWHGSVYNRNVQRRERHQQTKALDSHISVDVTQIQGHSHFWEACGKSEEIRGNPTLIQYKNHWITPGHIKHWNGGTEIKFYLYKCCIWCYLAFGGGFLFKARYQQKKIPWSRLSARLNGSTVRERDCDLSNSSSRSRLLEAAALT